MKKQLLNITIYIKNQEPVPLILVHSVPLPSAGILGAVGLEISYLVDLQLFSDKQIIYSISYFFSSSVWF